MALQINTGLTTNDGGVVASGAYIIFETYFPANATEYNISMRIYRDKASYDNDFRPLRGIMEIPTLSFNKDIVGNLGDLTFASINAEVVAHLETFVGSGNVSVVA